jgi:hypothetical protein
VSKRSQAAVVPSLPTLDVLGVGSYLMERLRFRLGEREHRLMVGEVCATEVV